jgi:hypothetical protein
MRRVEMVSGLLSGLLALAAVAFTATEHVMRSGTATTVYGPSVDRITTTSVILSIGLETVAALVVAVSATQDARREARGPWLWLLLLATLLSVGGIYLLVISDLWVVTGTLTAPGYEQISVGLLFAPAALAAILCAVVAALPRGQRQAPALA